MIILQTGVPGSGKTSSVIALLMKDESYTHFVDKDGVKKTRPLFVNGVNELKLPHEELTDEQIREQPFQDFLPYGSLVVIDEAQRLMGTRPPSRPVPHYIEALATHRHHGLDIILITQHPSFLDSFVRRLIQRHMHISIKPIGAKLYEWNECIDQPESSTNISKAIERSFTPPKEAFEQYKSAEVHTKPKRRLPWVLVLMILFVPVFVVLAYYAYHRLSSRFNSNPAQVAVEGEVGSVSVSSVQPSAANGGNLTAEMFVPVLAEKPESKPIYNQVRQVKTYERIAACITGGKSDCTCYSDQATPIKEVSKDLCREYAKNGLPFNPYKDDAQAVQQVQNQPQSVQQSDTSKVAVMGGKSPRNLFDEVPDRDSNHGAVVGS